MSLSEQSLVAMYRLIGLVACIAEGDYLSDVAMYGVFDEGMKTIVQRDRTGMNQERIH